MSKRRLMIITHDLGIGGLQQVVVNLCRYIDREKFIPSVLCLRKKGEFSKNVENMGIKVFSLPFTNRTDYFSFMKVAQVLREEKIEIIHTHNSQPFVDGTIGALMSGVKTIVHTDHARDFPDKIRYMFFEWLVSHFAYKIVGVSDHTSKNLIKYEKISPNKIITIPNGIEESLFNISIDKANKKKELGINNDGPILGLGVRLTEQKGITYLIQALPQIIEYFPEVTLVIAGDGPLKEELKIEANKRVVNSNIKFLGARIDIPELLKVFDLYVLPSNWEGLPMVLLEAMAAGCPIVATDVGGNSTAINHGINGSLVRPQDPKHLADEIIRILLNKDLMKQYSMNGIKIFKEKFSAERMTRCYELLYLREV